MNGRKNGNKRITLKQIAKIVGVSTMTVSRALNDNKHVDEETRRKVRKTARELGYFPNYIAKSLVQQRTQTIGVVVPEIAHSFFAQAVKGVEEEAWERGYQIMLTHSAEDTLRETHGARALASKMVDGLIVSTAESGSDVEFFKSLIKGGLRLVFFDRCIYDIGASCVSIDDVDSARRATEHLIDNGYRRVAHLRGSLALSIGRNRLKGYRDALADRGVPADDDLVVETAIHEHGGYEATKTLLALPEEKRPDAILAVNDTSAFGAMMAIAEAGLRVPDDVGVVGFYNDVRADLMPTPLTTITQPAREIGRIAARKMLAHIEDDSLPPENVVVPTELIVRASSSREAANSPAANI
jgi:DNA-binding LacI/PurR family transcriptional regulator